MDSVSGCEIASVYADHEVSSFMRCVLCEKNTAAMCRPANSSITAPSNIRPDRLAEDRALQSREKHDITHIHTISRITTELVSSLCCCC